MHHHCATVLSPVAYAAVPLEDALRRLLLERMFLYRFLIADFFRHAQLRRADHAANYFYDCSVHGTSMRGEMITTSPPVPPVPRVVSYSFGTNIVLRSSPATNTFTITPEFKTDLNNTNWVALTVLSNRLANGTNETFCGRPPGPEVYIRVRAQ